MKYGLIGKKLSHSFSKEVHNLIADYDYELFEIFEDKLEEFFKKKQFNAINVTIPYKEVVFKYLDNIDETAKQIGAVNTVVNKNGTLNGYNTDFYGLKLLINEKFTLLSEKKVLILGSGGTSKTAKAVCSSLNAKDVYVISRNPQNDEISYEDAVNIHFDANIIINTTPVGMHPDIDKSPIDISPFKNLQGVFDVIYNPLRSSLVLECEKRNIFASGGLFMLVAQAVFAYGLFNDKKIDENLINDIYNKILQNKRNIVFIGMPSSGKTTFSDLLTKEIGCELIDTDKMITQKAGISIKDIIKEHGEQYFRNIESQIIKEISTKNSCIIATGGGAVLREDNIKSLKHNGIIVFLDRPLEQLSATPDRPLSSNVKQLKELYENRIDLYKTYADFIVEVTDIKTTFREISNKIKEI